MSDAVLSAQGVQLCDRQGRTLVRDMGVEVAPGSLVGVVGESGAGKTLFARACLGLLPAGVRMRAGRVDLMGRDPFACEPRALRELLGRHVGYVPQNSVSYLHPGLKVSAQLSDGYRTWRHASRAQGRARALRLLDQVGIDDPERVLESYPGELSGGMRQRVNIAMALMAEPLLVVADEPTAALDAITRVQVAELLQRVCEERGAALLMVSHDLGLVRRICQSVLVMRAGALVEAGDASEVLTHPARPYTQALLAAVPRVGQPRDCRLPEYADEGPDEAPREGEVRP